MSIFLNKDSKVIVQGITGGEGTKHTALMLKAGTQVVGGVNARKAGTTVSHTDAAGNPVELPVFGSVAEAAPLPDARAAAGGGGGSKADPLLTELRARRKARMRTLAIRSAIGVATLVVLALVGLYWLLQTVAGRDVLLAQVIARLPAGRVPVG